ncbi:MAG: hypothetical protein OEY97_11065 [Nitrospirota bacterium]|nr:hypothetical protein [Nitrospirota bacterium]
MAIYNLRRFSRPDELKAIGPDHLLTLLEPYSDYFAERGVTLPPAGAADGVPYKDLAGVFMSPDTSTPSDLVDALYFIDEMATPEGMDQLLHEAEQNDIDLNGKPDPTPADVAVQVWLADRELLERKHAEQYLTKRRSFEYFQTDQSPVPVFKTPSREKLKALAEAMDDWFEQKKRGRDSRVFAYPKPDGIWFLVRHGEPYKREGSIEEGESKSVFYRPEKHDVLVYNPALGELRMNAGSKGEKELYRAMFGLHLFGSENFFPKESKYTLEPLRTDGEAALVCSDIEGMEWARMKEVRFYWGGHQNEVEIRKADDVFAALSVREKSLPEKARIIRASFQVKFTDAKTPRTVTIRPSNIADYTRDGDSSVVEEWLTKRGFIRAANQEGHGQAAAMAGA